MAVMLPPAHVSAPPATPDHFREYYFSAPTSPAHLSDHFYHNNNGDDFAFDVSEEMETSSLSAEELFDGGVIKPMKPPPLSELSPANGKSKNISSPPRKNKEMEPGTAQNAAKAAAPPRRGRKRGVNLFKTPRRRAARSLSPIRDTQYPWEEEQEENDQTKTKNSLVCSTLAAYKKWRLKDFFLFRSASEGRAADKDPLKKYTASCRQSSFRAIESSGSVSGSRRKGPVSAHEMHYTLNRAVSEDLKKKTFLPYKQGILGRLAFNPAAHAVANGFGFSRK